MPQLVFHPIPSALLSLITDYPHVLDAMRARPMELLSNLVPCVDEAIRGTWWKHHRDHAVLDADWISVARAARHLRPEAAELFDALDPAVPTVSDDICTRSGQERYRMVPTEWVLRLADVLESIKPKELKAHLDDPGLAAFRKLVKKADDWRIQGVSLVIFLQTAPEAVVPPLLPATRLALALIRMREANALRDCDDEFSVRIGAPAAPATRERIAGLLGGRLPPRLDELLTLAVSVRGGHPDSDDEVLLDFESARSGDEVALPNTLVLRSDETGVTIAEPMGDDLSVWRIDWFGAPTYSFTLISRSLIDLLERSAHFVEGAGEEPFGQAPKECSPLTRKAARVKVDSDPELATFVEGLPEDALIYDLRKKKAPVGCELDEHLGHELVISPGYFQRKGDLFALVLNLAIQLVSASARGRLGAD